jgi:hypothetical protein
MMAANAWMSWETQDAQIGARPFDVFPAGTPDGAIICRWGAAPEVATDNITDLAWTPVDADDAAAAMQALQAAGYTRIDAPEGTFLAAESSPGYGDADGWGTTYLFTLDDVRWALTKADVTNYVKSPTEND